MNEHAEIIACDQQREYDLLTTAADLRYLFELANVFREYAQPAEQFPKGIAQHHHTALLMLKTLHRQILSSFADMNDGSNEHAGFVNLGLDRAIKLLPLTAQKARRLANDEMSDAERRSALVQCRSDIAEVRAGYRIAASMLRSS